MKLRTGLSVFNGGGGAHHSLSKENFTFDNFYFSEIDKYANIINQKHFPKDIPLGDIMNWESWNIDWSSVDLIMGGSPCTGFSRSGKLGGTKAKITKNNITEDIVVTTLKKYLELKSSSSTDGVTVEFLSQSALIWEFFLIVNHVKKHNPNVKFFLENVQMDALYSDMITKNLGVEPILINSALISPQQRKRLYWCNWETWQPEQVENLNCKNFMFDLSIGSGVCELKHFKDGFQIKHCANAVDIKGMECIKRVYHPDGKCPTLTTMGGGHREPKLLCKDGNYRKANIIEMERFAGLDDNYTEGVSNTQRKKIIGNGWELNTIRFLLRCLKKSLK